jgi:S-adenosylmethionine decarboxylase proenzyme
MVDLYECDVAALNSVEVIREYMLEAARRCGATVVTSCFHHFSPHGVSGVVVIAESHLAIHTWPEHGYAAVDLFTCGHTLEPERCFEYLRDALKSGRHTTRVFARGEQLPHPSPGAHP